MDRDRGGGEDSGKAAFREPNPHRLVEAVRHGSGQASFKIGFLETVVRVHVHVLGAALNERLQLIGKRFIHQAVVNDCGVVIDDLHENEDQR